jgi:dTDP-4-amino-4,6-dideoxygalactose transaminase
MTEDKHIPFLDLSRQTANLRIELDDAWNRVLSSGRFLSGEEVEAFEEEFSAWVGKGYAAACSSGTDALELILRAWNIGHGDEVIVPANTWVSDAEVVVRVGAVPVFADCEDDNGLLSAEKIRPLITSRTKALIVVHMYGTFNPLEELLQLGKQHGFFILEDCAHAVGLWHDGQMAGTFGDAAAFSFYPTKNMGALGDAGCIITTNEDLINKIKLLRDHGQQRRDHHILAGTTARMDEIQAAVLRIKLKYVDKWNESRRSHALKFKKAVDTNEKIALGFEWMETTAAHLFVIRTNNRQSFIGHLNDARIGYGMHYPDPLPIMPAFRHVSYNTYPNAEKRAAQIISLPVFPELTPAEILRIENAIRHF